MTKTEKLVELQQRMINAQRDLLMAQLMVINAQHDILTENGYYKDRNNA